MDDMVHVVCAQGQQAQRFAFANQIPRTRLKVYTGINDLFGAKFGKFVYVLAGGVSPVMQHEVRWRADHYCSTLIECQCFDVVEKTWA
jgi:hypothetical protein